jgi:hypothetical protein
MTMLIITLVLLYIFLMIGIVRFIAVCSDREDE